MIVNPDDDDDDERPPLPPEGFANLYLPLMGGKWVLIAVEEAIVSSTNEHEVEVQGGRNYLMVVTDDYHSREVPGGRERYVRVLEPISGEEKWHLLAHSDTYGHRGGEPLVTWHDDQNGFTIHLADRPPISVGLSEWGEVTVNPPAGA